jgi:hypothetical protein
MSMIKKEKEHVEILETKLALHFTNKVLPDLPPPQFGNGGADLVNGWSFNLHSKRAYKSCSSSIYHGDGWGQTRSSQPIHQYSTEELALRALRNELENEYASQLRNIDKRIEELKVNIGGIMEGDK